MSVRPDAVYPDWNVAEVFNALGRVPLPENHSAAKVEPQIYFAMIVAATFASHFIGQSMPFWNKKKDSKAIHQQGVEALERGQMPLALKMFTEVIGTEPTSERHYYRGVIHDIMGDPKSAVKDLNRATSLDSTNSQAWYSLAIIHQQQGNIEPAFDAVKQAHEIDSDDFRIANVYARLLVESPIDEHLDPALAAKISKHACDLTNWEDAICVETHKAALAAVGDNSKATEIETPDPANLAAPSYSDMVDFPDITQDLIAHVEKRFKKKANQLALQNIIPTTVPIAVQTIESKSGKGLNVIFTTGMSSEPMKVSSKHELKYAELFMVIPATYRAPKKIDESIWPWQCMQGLGQMAHLNDKAYPKTPEVVVFGDSPKPLGGNTDFAAFLMLPSLKGYIEPFEVAPEKVVKFVAAVPIYAEEFAMGVGPLLTRFKETKTKPHFTPGRPNLATL